MKTIPELSERYGIHRDTLRKAAIREEFPARKAGERVYLIDDESPEFQMWLESRERKIDMATKWIEHKNYYEYPTQYSTRVRAARAAQKLEQKLGIIAETSEQRDEYTQEVWYIVTTKNDVPHT